MLIGLISSSNALHEFHGYIDKNASSRKIICNVFKQGDRAFVTGEHKMPNSVILASH
jgi:hypothetical protein